MLDSHLPRPRRSAGWRDEDHQHEHRRQRRPAQRVGSDALTHQRFTATSTVRPCLGLAGGPKRRQGILGAGIRREPHVFGAKLGSAGLGRRSCFRFADGFHVLNGAWVGNSPHAGSIAFRRVVYSRRNTTNANISGAHPTSASRRLRRLLGGSPPVGRIPDGIPLIGIAPGGGHRLGDDGPPPGPMGLVHPAGSAGGKARGAATGGAGATGSSAFAVAGRKLAS